MNSFFKLAEDASSIIGQGALDACKTSCNTASSFSTIFQSVANVLIFLIGAVSVIMMIIGGFRYVISQGESKETAAAKDTILYAAIGIVVALASFSIVNFVIINVK